MNNSTMTTHEESANESNVIHQNQSIVQEKLNKITITKQELLDLIKSQYYTQKIITDFIHSLNEYLEKIDNSREMGRALVQQKAKNLDLERQNHRLREELRTAPPPPSPPLPPPPSLKQIFPVNDLMEIKDIAQNLTSSRALGALSLITPGPRKTVLEIAEKLEALTRKLDK
jgi:hypothetical protein